MEMLAEVETPFIAVGLRAAEEIAHRHKNVPRHVPLAARHRGPPAQIGARIMPALA
jgi:hypothetical protein